MFAFPQRSSLQVHSGQVGVIMVLIMSVMLTIGLSVASNTVQDIEITRQEEESNRVFNAAEAGLEQALSQDFTDDPQGGSITSIPDVDVNFTISQTNQLETRLFEGVGVWVDVGNAVDGDQINLNFSKQSDCGAASENDRPASIIVSIYNNDGSGARVRHYVSAGCDRGDQFPLANVVSTANGFTRRMIVDLVNDDFLMTIKPLYNDTHVFVAGRSGYVIPNQGFDIRSEAISQLGDETRIVGVNRSLPSAPSIFDYAVFSGTTVVK